MSDKKYTQGKWWKVLAENHCLAIRNSGGILIRFWKPYFYNGQMERFVSETEETQANLQLCLMARENFELMQELAENLELQLNRLGCCGQGDGKDRRADTDSFGGVELLNRANELIKKTNEYER